MAYTRVEENQFEWKGQVVVHVPTGARLNWSYPNSESDDIKVNWGRAGDVLADGRDFDRDEVLRVAMTLLQRARSKG